MATSEEALHHRIPKTPAFFQHGKTAHNDEGCGYAREGRKPIWCHLPALLSVIQNVISPSS